MMPLDIPFLLSRSAMTTMGSRGGATASRYMADIDRRSPPPASGRARVLVRRCAGPLVAPPAAVVGRSALSTGYTQRPPGASMLRAGGSAVAASRAARAGARCADSRARRSRAPAGLQPKPRVRCPCGPCSRSASSDGVGGCRGPSSAPSWIKRRNDGNSLPQAARFSPWQVGGLPVA
jgi:hypothetical protein